MITLEEATKRYLALADELSVEDMFALGTSVALGLLTRAKQKGELAETVCALIGARGLVMLVADETTASAQWAVVRDHPIAQLIVTEATAMLGDYLRKRIGRIVDPVTKEPLKA